MRTMRVLVPVNTRYAPYHDKQQQTNAEDVTKDNEKLDFAEGNFQSVKKSQKVCRAPPFGNTIIGI